MKRDRQKNMKQLNTALFASFAIIVLFAAAFAFDYFRKLEASTPSDMLDDASRARQAETLRGRHQIEAREDALAPAVEAAERVDSILRDNRSGLLESALPEALPVGGIDPLSAGE